MNYNNFIFSGTEGPNMEIVTDRRALHRIPELDRHLPETCAYLRGRLEGLGCRVFSPMEGAVCAWFDFGRENAVAFRADADALPITEATGAPYASAHPGAMHACGHDGHMAIVLELARRLSRKKAMPHNVLLVFQPAEETTGGARDLCETGLFRQYRAEAIFGLHLWPGLEAGVIASRKNELMARSCEVNVDLYGKSAHIAKAAQGVDALAAGMFFYGRVTAAEQALPPAVFRLLKFGKCVSGSVRNALSDHTRLEGSLRAFQDDVFEQLQQAVRDAGAETDRQFGTRTEIAMSSGYPAVMNPPDLFNRVARAVSFRTLEAPSMTAEDFSWYQKTLPGMFFFLGVGDVPALHSDRFDFDDGILSRGADFFEQLGERFV